MGGASIFEVKEDDANIGVIIETLTEHGKRYAMIQNYIPAIKDGDKRVLVVDGEVVPYCLAYSSKRRNAKAILPLVVAVRCALSPMMSAVAIAGTLAPSLKAKGLLFVGLDIIGDKLTEVNVTAPTCVKEIEAESNFLLPHCF